MKTRSSIAFGVVLLAGCGAPAPVAVRPPAPVAMPAPPLPDCRITPEQPTAPLNLEGWLRASRDGGVRRLSDLGGISGGFQAVLGAARLNLRPLGGAYAMPQVELETEPGALTSLFLGDAPRWPTPLEALDGEPVHLGSPLGPLAIRGAFETDVTGDGVPEAIFVLTAAGQRSGPADEDAFLASREMEASNAFTALLIVDALHRAAYTVPLQAAHQHRVHGSDGLERQRRVTFLSTVPPPLPWTRPFTLSWQGVSRAQDSQTRLRREAVVGGTLHFGGRGYGAPFERRETCRRGP